MWAKFQGLRLACSHTNKLQAWSHLTTELKLNLVLFGIRISASGEAKLEQCIQGMSVWLKFQGLRLACLEYAF